MSLTVIIGSGFAFALLLSLILTVIVRNGARQLGLVDQPDGDRKAHSRPTPNVGGVAIFASTAITLGIGVGMGGLDLWRPDADLRVVLALAGGGTLVWLLGIVDDLVGLSVKTRFLLEFALAALLVVVGVRIDVLGMADGTPIVIPLLISVPLTILWIVGVTNAFNLLDGSDGVAGGSALFALLTLGTLSAWWGQPAAAITCFVLAGAVAGFLFFNFPPASIFMGDSGSLFLGFSLASLGVLTTQKVPTLLAIAIPIVAFGVPVLDTLLAMVRRVLRGEPIYRPDRGHIHHRLRDLGHSPRRVALVVWGMSGALSVLALLMAGGEARVTGFALALVGAIVLVFVQRLRIPELLELGRLLNSAGSRRARIDRSVRLREAAQALEGAAKPKEVLDALHMGFERSEFSHLELWLSEEVGEPFRTLDDVRVSLRGFETIMDLSPATVSGSELEVRLSVCDESNTPIARLLLKHGLDEPRFPTDLVVVMDWVLPAFRAAVLRLSSPSSLEAPVRATVPGVDFRRGNFHTESGLAP